MTAPGYQVKILALDSTIIDEVPASNLVYSYAVNAPGGVAFTVPLMHPKCVRSTLAPGERIIQVYRGNAPVWGGYLWQAKPDLSTDMVDFTGKGWLSMLEHRHIDQLKSYAAQDQTTAIAWDLINFTQGKTNGDLGFTNGSVASGVLRDRTYYPYERKKILDALTELAAVQNGFDFSIDANRVFRTHYPSKGVVTNWTFELGKNIKAPSLIYDGERVVTEMTGIGAGEGDKMLLSTQSDVTALTRFNLRQDSISLKDISVQTNLDDATKEKLRQLKDVIEQPEDMEIYFTDDLPFGSVAEGDVVRIRATRGYVNFDVTRRVVVLTVNVDDETSKETIGFVFDRSLSE